MSIADDLVEQGRKEGVQEGQRKMLLNLLGVRFGTLPEAVVARVNTAGQALLEQWSERVLTAPSLTEVLSEG